MSKLSLTFLGTFQAFLDGNPITEFEADKVRALLAYLAMEADQPHRRDALAGLLWPDWPDRSARTNLRNALANLRGAIGDRNVSPPFLFITRETIRFNLQSDHWLDAAAFIQLAVSDDLSTLEEAAALYHGDFLGGFQLKDSATFENWHLLTRERLRRQQSTILHQLTEGYRQQRNYERATAFAWQKVELEPWQEAGHQQLMRLLALSGQRSVALAQYDICRRQLKRELGVEPSAETTQLYEQIRDGEQNEPDPTPFPEIPPAPGIPPYKGLQFFDETDANWFFGRETLTNRLAAQIEPSNGHCFLAVVGASGSGKSSIVRAGLIPALRQKFADLPIYVLTPTSHPLHTLAARLSNGDVSPLIDDMIRDPNSLNRHIAGILPVNTARLLLVVDQFEELFTQCHDKIERQAFVDNLMAAVSETAVVVITLRADFYTHCGMYASLREALETRQVYIGSMTPDELRRAVVEPARLGDWTFEPGLVDLMLQEVTNEPGALPLLSHALLETWQRRRGHMLTLSGYNEAGGVRGAIARTAERVMQQMTPDQRAIARNIFLRLTELGSATQETRRRARLSELTEGPENTTVSQVLQTLVDARLVIAGKESAEVAHEALIREWPMLRDWLEKDQDGLRIHRHLTDAAQEWERLGREASELYRGARLATCSEWAAAQTGVLNPLEQAFLTASQEWMQRREEEQETRRQRELALERRRAEEHAQSARRLRSRARLLVGVSLITVALAIFAFIARANAQRETAVNRSLVLANLAVEANEAGEVDRALALALEAVNMDAPPPEAVTKLAAVASGMGTRAVLTGHHGAVYAGDFSPDGTQALTAGCTIETDAACPAGEFILWDLAAMTETARWSGHEGGVTALAWRPGSDEALSGSEDGYLILWNVPTQEQLAIWETGGGTIHAIAIAPDGETAVAAGDDGALIVLDLSLRQIRQRLQGHNEAALVVAFSPDGTQVLSGSADKTMILWDADTGEPLQTFMGSESAIVGIAFLPDGKTVLSGNRLALRLWDIASGQEVQLRESGDTITHLVLSPDGSTVLHTVDHMIYTWDVNQWFAPHRKIAGLLGVNHETLVVNDNGRFALTGDSDGAVRIWNLSGANDLQQTDIGFSATGLALSPDGQRLAIGGWGHDGVIWNITKGEPILELTGGLQLVAPGAIAYSPDGNWVASGSGLYDTGENEGSLLVWNADTGDVECTLQDGPPRLRAVAFSPDSQYLLSGSQGEGVANELLLWSVVDCSLARRFQTEDDTTGIDFSGDARYALTSSAFSGKVTLWQVVTGEAVQVWSLSDEVFLDAAFGPNDKTALAGTLGGKIIQWDVATGAEINRLTGHDGGVWSLALSPDERYLASSDDTGTVILWDVATGAELRRHNVHNALSFHVAFSPDGQTLYSVSADKTLVAWQLGDPSLSALHAWIKANRFVRPLTCEERAQFNITPLCYSQE